VVNAPSNIEPITKLTRIHITANTLDQKFAGAKSPYLIEKDIPYIYILKKVLSLNVVEK